MIHILDYYVRERDDKDSKVGQCVKPTVRVLEIASNGYGLYLTRIDSARISH